MLISELVKIEVTPDIAAKIRVLAEAGVFTLDTGSAEIHFKDCALLKIITHRTSSYPQLDITQTSSIL